MEYLSISFDGNIHSWISAIISSDTHILVQPGESENPTKETLLQADSSTHSDKKLVGLFTSASTGNEKCVWNSFDNLFLNAKITAREFDINPDDRLLMMAKSWHIAGLSWMLMARELEARWQFIPTKRGGVKKWHQTIIDFKPDCLLTVPAVLAQLMEFNDWFVPKIIFGGAALDSKYYPLLSQYCNTVYQAYGQTEAGGLITCKKIGNDQLLLSNEINNCFGHPPKEFVILCEGTPNNPRAIFLNSPTAMHSSYYNTGDLGYLDDRELFLSGRS